MRHSNLTQYILYILTKSIIIIIIIVIIRHELGLKGKGKGKAIPLEVWRGPEGSRRLRLPDFKTIGT